MTLRKAKTIHDYRTVSNVTLVKYSSDQVIGKFHHNSRFFCPSYIICTIYVDHIILSAISALSYTKKPIELYKNCTQLFIIASMFDSINRSPPVIIAQRISSIPTLSSKCEASGRVFPGVVTWIIKNLAKFTTCE